MTPSEGADKTCRSLWSPEQLEAFKSLAQLVSLKANTQLWEEKNSSPFIFLIESGYVRLYDTALSGKITTVAIRVPGNFIGISSALIHYNWLFAETIGACTVWKLDNTSFVNLLYDDSTLAVQISRDLCLRLHDSQMTILSLSSLELNGRIAKILLYLAESTTPAAPVFQANTVYATHQEIAQMAGACRQSTTTALGHLKRLGLIRLLRKRIEITNRRKLEELVANG